MISGTATNDREIFFLSFEKGHIAKRKDTLLLKQVLILEKYAELRAFLFWTFFTLEMRRGEEKILGRETLTNTSESQDFFLLLPLKTRYEGCVCVLDD